MTDAEFRIRNEMDKKSSGRKFGYCAAQIAMRWICGLPATEACVYMKAKAIRGSKRPPMAEKQLLSTLAGFAYQAEYGKNDIDYDYMTTADLSNAFRILEGCEQMRVVAEMTPDGPVAITEEADVAFTRYFEKACRILEEHLDLIDFIKSKLRLKADPTAEEVASMWKEYEHSESVKAA